VRGSAGGIGRYCDENSQKVLDAPVAIAQQAKRFIETMVDRLSDLDRHEQTPTEQTAATTSFSRATARPTSTSMARATSAALCAGAKFDGEQRWDAIPGPRRLCKSTSAETICTNGF
jgi:hypothetical protein